MCPRAPAPEVSLGLTKKQLPRDHRVRLSRCGFGTFQLCQADSLSSRPVSVSLGPERSGLGSGEGRVRWPSRGGGLCGAGTGAARAKALRSGTGGREERGPRRDPRLVLSEAGATGGFRVEEGWGLRREMMVGLGTGSEGGGWGTLGLWEGTGRGRCRVSLAAALWASGCLSCPRAGVPRRPKHRARWRLSWERWRRPGVAPTGRGVVSPGYGTRAARGLRWFWRRSLPRPPARPVPPPSGRAPGTAP